MGQATSSTIDYDYQAKPSPKQNTDTDTSAEVERNQTKIEIDDHIEKNENILTALLNLLKYYTNSTIHDQKFKVKNNLIISELDEKLDEVNKLIKENDSRILNLKENHSYKLNEIKNIESINMYLKYATMGIVLITAYIKLRM